MRNSLQPVYDVGTQMNVSYNMSTKIKKSHKFSLKRSKIMGLGASLKLKKYIMTNSIGD